MKKVLTSEPGGKYLLYHCANLELLPSLRLRPEIQSNSYLFYICRKTSI